MKADHEEITQLLLQWQNGNKLAESRLFEQLLPQLRQIAARCFGRERPGHLLQPTALVNEAFLTLANSHNIAYRDRGHFLALSARIMRRYLIDHWRSNHFVSCVPLAELPEGMGANFSQSLEFTKALDVSLDELALHSPRQRDLVELKFFLGFTDTAAAQALNLPLRTLQREWLRARKWLFERLSGASCRPILITTNR